MHTLRTEKQTARHHSEHQVGLVNNKDEQSKSASQASRNKRIEAALKILVSHLMKHSPNLREKLRGIIDSSDS